MKTRNLFKVDAYTAAKLCVEAGLEQVVIAFDYKPIVHPDQKPTDVTQVQFFHLHASDIVQGVDKGDLPL